MATDSVKEPLSESFPRERESGNSFKFLDARSPLHACGDKVRGHDDSRLDQSLLGGTAFLRLLQLASPMLPVGAFAYSQGLEWAVEAGQVRNEAQARDWILGLIDHSLARLDVPVLARLHRAWAQDDLAAVRYWSQIAHAARESAELRAESRQIGAAAAKILSELGLTDAAAWVDAPCVGPPTLFALAAARWQLPLAATAQAYVWAWAENQATCAMKLVPLGQTAGQRILSAAAAAIPAAVARGLDCDDDAIGSFAPGLALASARHETQYTRLFRS